MKKTLAILLLLLLPLTFVRAQMDSAAHNSLTAKQVADSVIALSKEYLGTRYHYGSQGPSAFDCSGFTGYIYRQFGINLSRSSTGQATDGREVEGPLSELQKGDIVVFSGRHNTRSIGHVGIFIELDPDRKSFSFIHAAHGGVKISHLKETYYKDRFLGARRVLPDFCTLCPDTADTTDNHMHGNVVEVPKMVLDSTYSLILLSDNGKWVYVLPDGTLQQPDSAAYIVLTGDTWKQHQHATMQIPSLRHPQKTTSYTGTSSQQTSSGEQGAVYHTITQGNTLSGIAKKYGTTVNRICQLNGITVKTTLRIGKKIRVK